MIGPSTRISEIKTEVRRLAFEEGAKAGYNSTFSEPIVGWNGYILYSLRLINSKDDSYIYEMMKELFEYGFIPNERQAMLEANIIEDINKIRRDYCVYFADGEATNSMSELNKPIMFAEIMLYFGYRLSYEIQKSLAGCLELILINNGLYIYGRPLKDGQPIVKGAMSVKIESMLSSDYKTNQLGLLEGVQVIPVSWFSQYQVYLNKIMC